MTEHNLDRTPSAADAETTAETIEELQRQLIHWRAQALRGWADAVADDVPRVVVQAPGDAEAHRVAAEAIAQLEAMRQSTSWRVTAPLRAVTDAVRARRAR